MIEEPTPLARRLYALRWWSTLLVLGVVALALAQGSGRLAAFNAGLGELGDVGNGSESAPPVVFDSRMDIWFGAEDEAVQAYRSIEDRFVAEDYLIVSFADETSPFGVFGEESLARIARLTDAFLAVPGVRHVRSLTSNPWIRWGRIEDETGFDEPGLLISDLVEGDPRALSDDQRIERMVAVLGARRVAERLGEDVVRRVLGPDAAFDDFAGEPLLLGTIVDPTGTTTALQIQVLRPRVDGSQLDAAFGDDASAREVAPALFSVVSQRASMRGLEHAVRREQGLVVLAPEHAELAAWIEGLPAGDERAALAAQLADPTRSFQRDADGTLRRKWFEYQPDGEGGYVDLADPAAPVPAPDDFRPAVSDPVTIHFGGAPFFERNFEQVGMADAKYMALMFAVIVVLLALIFRNLMGVVAPMAVVALSVAGMVGFLFAIGDLFNNMTMVSPNMLTAVGIADAIHLVAAWASLRHQEPDTRRVLLEVLRRNALPVFLTSLTTSLGFLSLTVSDIVPVRMLGYTAAVGTLLAWMLSMTLVPALLSLVPAPKDAGTARPGPAVAHTAWAASFTRLLLRFRAPVIGFAVLVLIASAVGLWRLEIDSDFRAMFPDSNPVMQDFRWIEGRLGGVGDLELVFEGPAGAQQPSLDERQRLGDLRLTELGAEQWPDEFAPLSDAERVELAALSAAERDWMARRIGISSAFLTRLDAFETRLRGEMADPASPLRIITDFLSPLDVLRKMHQVQHENRSSFYRVPDEADVPADLRAESLDYDEWTEEWLHVPPQDASSLVAQYYLQYENGARPGENLSTQLSADRTVFRMQGRVSQATANLQNQAFARLAAIAREEFPELDGGDDALSELTLSGKTLLYARTNRIFTLGFLQSMSLALVLITVLIAIIFRSLRLALISLAPNVLPILLPISFFGLIGVPLDGPAVFVSSVALGVCVDDTIHFFTKFSRARAKGLSLEDALRTAFEQVGVALTITSVVLVVGFGTLVLSDFSPNSMMGTLAVIMISLAWGADFFLVPALLSFLPDTRSDDAPEPEPALPAHPTRRRTR